MAKMRREEIADAFERQFIPRAVPPPTQRMSPIDLAGYAISKTLKEELPVGAMTKVLYQLPEAEREHVTRVANLVADHEDAGRHGNKKGVYEHFEIDPKIGERVLSGLQTDHVANELINRRGNDSSLPLPELTRRDVLAAAFDANQE